MVAAVAVFLVAFLGQSVVLLSRSSPRYQTTAVTVRGVGLGRTPTACAMPSCASPESSPNKAGDVVTFLVRGDGTSRLPTCTVKAAYRGRRYGPVSAAISASPGAPGGPWSGRAVLGADGGGLTTKDTSVHCR
jgi:hypothetical protein